jgi:hypothetical protein
MDCVGSVRSVKGQKTTDSAYGFLSVFIEGGRSATLAEGNACDSYCPKKSFMGSLRAGAFQEYTIMDSRFSVSIAMTSQVRISYGH